MCMILGRKIMDTKTKQIRENERLSHTEIYTKEKLYDTDTWLKKPITGDSSNVYRILRKYFQPSVEFSKIHGYFNIVYLTL